jgi:LacI family transcriptional regulator
MGAETELDRGARVHMDDVEASRIAVRHLLKLGHRRIGFISGGPRYGASAARRAGYLQAMRELDAAVSDDWLLDGDFTFDTGVGCAGRLLTLQPRPTAVFASNDDMALGVMHAAAGMGLSVPLDLSVVGFDDTLSARFTLPPLTTVRQPVAAMAGRAADMLIERSRSGRPVVEDALIPFEFIVRGTTAPPRAP